MVRRSTVDRSPQPAGHSVGYEAGTSDLAQDGARYRSSPGWRGAGGRWLVWAFRAVIWAVLLIIGYRGVMAIVLNETPPSGHAVTSTPAGAGFPAELAGAFALQFGQVYLNASPATSAQRASELAQFLPPGTDPQLGWNGQGSLRLESESIANVAVRDTHHAMVTLLARVNGSLMELGVPVYAAGGRIVVSGEPAWLGAPQRTALRTPPPVTSDAAATVALTSQLPAFFGAYASGDKVTLARFLVPGAVVTGLNNQVTFGSLAGVTVPPGGDTRHATATVVWRVPAPPGGRAASGPEAQMEMTYALTIVKLNGTWYVKNISPSSLAASPP